MRMLACNFLTSPRSPLSAELEIPYTILDCLDVNRRANVVLGACGWSTHDQPT